jgi:DNA-binding CsgD family transcriptional regulator
MINQRVAEVLAYEIHGTAWEAACLKKGLDPSSATADDVLGPMSVRLTYGGGKPVLPYDDERLAEVLEELEAEPVVPDLDPKAFVAEVTEIAGLTKTERRVVGAIVDGSPIPDGKQYAGILGKRLNMGVALVWKHWSNAKRKLRDNWAAQ